MKTLIITAVAMSLGLLSSSTFAGGSIVGSHATPIVDPDPAGIGTYLVSAVLLALGIRSWSSVRTTRAIDLLRVIYYQ